MNKIEIQQLPNESDYNFAKRKEAINYLGGKWILAHTMKRPEVVAWKG